ncbi:hypothetical protein AB7M63_007745 [Bradyrhizobium japonicum]
MIKHLRSKLAAAALIAATVLPASAAHAQQKSEISLSRSPAFSTCRATSWKSRS